MSTNGARDQGGITIIIASSDAEVIDNTPNRGGPFAEYDRYDEPTKYDYIRCPVYGAEVLDGEMSTASHRPTYRYE